MSDDPILVQRARMARIARIGKRIGYLALLVASVGFFTGLALDFPPVTVGLAIGGLVTGCVVLPIPIIIGYGVRAAAREDRERA